MAYILGIGTASPQYAFSQEDIACQMIQKMELSKDQTCNLKRLYINSGIKTRYSVLPDLDFLFSQPTAQQRNEIYKKEAPLLALKAAKKAIALWGGEAKNITHIVSVSCTGMMAPGIECYLIKELDLPSQIPRVGVNFMGCFGAFNGISVARALAKENGKNRVLVVCTELSSLQAQLDSSSHSVLANTLFGDGAAACLISGEKSETYLWEIKERASSLVPNSTQFMSWDVAVSGFSMRLSSKLPVLIRKSISQFVKSLLGANTTFEKCHWAIHPGGKSILQAIEKECNLQISQTETTWETLKNYGNMSSATILFILEESLRKYHEWTVGLAFGPGLSIEGMLLRSYDVAKSLN